MKKPVELDRWIMCEYAYRALVACDARGVRILLEKRKEGAIPWETIDNPSAFCAQGLVCLAQLHITLEKLFSSLADPDADEPSEATTPGMRIPTMPPAARAEDAGEDKDPISSAYARLKPGIDFLEAAVGGAP